MPAIFAGVGAQTIAATAATIGLGVVTPAECYVGLAGRTPSNTFDLADPIGTLGCQYDIGNTRVFAEHISSPAVGNDFPGINHAGIKQLVINNEDFAVYLGASYALASEQLNGNSFLAQAGMEVGDDNIKFYGEYIMSVENPEDGMMTGGIKFLF